MVKAGTASVVAKLPLTGKQEASRYDRFIVTYRPESAEAGDGRLALQNIQAAISHAGLDGSARSSMAPLRVFYQRKLATGDDLVRTSRQLDQAQADALMKQIAADPAVVHVEPDVMLHAVRDIVAPLGATPQAFTPNDPLYGKYQWHFNDPVGGATVSDAWDLADGTDITVAVLDTGITRHPDIDISLAEAGYDFITDGLVSGRGEDGRVPGGWDTGDWTTTEPYLSACTDSSNPPEDSSWHGTHVAGTVAERTNNGQGMAGIAYNAKLLPVRVLGHCGGTTSDIADAVIWASGGHVDGVPDNQNPAQVINMSLGGRGICTAESVMARAIADARSRGTTVVVAAGNENTDVANYTPAGCPGAITVASNGITGKRAFYSSYGAGVALSAPGGGYYTNDDPDTGSVANPEGFVWSAMNSGKTEPDEPDYGGSAGTSQATPHVAGTIALVLSAMKQAGLAAPTPDQIRDILVQSARRFPVSTDRPIGAGIVNAHAAVNLALGNDGGDDDAIVLAPGVLLSGQSGGTGSQVLYAIEVPAGARNLSLRTIGGSGDVSLFVKVGSAPSVDGSGADFRSVKPGNNEAVVIAKPQPGTYYLRMVSVTAYDKVSVLATYTQ
jgi:serine protease